ncbi:hypothetical protein BST97_08925 [Nonlabens spongiae]|uniref:Heme oxygenase n=1 Tax=Nonlabens spongiae TaxID=331648 RepID=A0A1W6MKI7_9FLAO|nr:biliverdin-producing heme oxygenase [Nonlabens spongiae]ARN78111.1 hypothetical protein BST97_08925 [Nonlabens spongiae]
MELIERIRKESRAIHDRLEGASGVDKIMDGSVTDQQVEEILIKNYLAFAKAEQQITQFHTIERPMSHRILEDLDQEQIDANLDDGYQLNNKYEALGARYVLNGSMLGAAVIGKNLRSCPRVSQKDWQFYRKPNADERKAWPELLQQINHEDYSKEQQDQVLNGVMKTFDLFEAVYGQPVKSLERH